MKRPNQKVSSLLEVASNTLNPKSVITRRHTGVSYSRLGDEILVIDTTKRKSHRLLETAAFLWDHCDGRTSVDQLAQSLTEHYDVEHEVANRDVLEIMTSWLNEEIVSVGS